MQSKLTVPAMIRSLLTSGLLATTLALVPASASAQATPSKQSLNALSGLEFTSSAFSGVATQQTRFGSAFLSRTLASALQHSRDIAREDSLPIPEEIREALIPYYPEKVLDDVRYKIGDTTPNGVAGFAIRNGNAAAVTLIDTIIFDSEEHLQNIALWAHELHHVEQFATWGLDGFAERYAFGWNNVEKEARDRTQNFVTWYKDRHAIQ